MLHSFYNGIENAFKRIAEEFGGRSPRSESWHRDLLDSMNRPGKDRPAVISDSMVELLDSYLGEIYLQHRMRDWMDRTVVHLEDQPTPKIICSEALP